MNKVMISVGVSLLLACAPELREGEGERCDASSSCSAGLECYRGYCVPDPSSTAREPGLADLDAGMDQPPATVYEEGLEAGGPTTPVDASVASNSTPTGAADAAAKSHPEDGGAVTHTAADASPAVTPAPATPSVPPTSPGPSATPEPAPKPPKSAPPPTSSVDAGSLVDAAAGPLVDAAVVPPLDAAVMRGKCTLQECCAEARRKSDDDKDDEEEGKGSKGEWKRCGCANPALLQVLTCRVFTPAGLLR